MEKMSSGSNGSGWVYNRYRGRTVALPGRKSLEVHRFKRSLRRLSEAKKEIPGSPKSNAAMGAKKLGRRRAAESQSSGSGSGRPSRLAL
jgi:hypothetical protein